jgi:tetratricopeptide (TPR) repeat protein
MKLSTTSAVVLLLGCSGWAAMPAALAPAAGAYFQATCPTPAAPVPTAKMKWKHGIAEYNDFAAATKAAANPAHQAQLAAAFVQKYPDSDYKNQALQVEMGAQAKVPGQQAQAIKTAEALIQSPGATAAELLPAYTVIAYLDPGLVQPNDPNMASKMASLTQAATCGKQMLSAAPAGARSQYNAIMTKALGFAQLNSKDYSDAIATLTKATQQSPKDPLPYYWLGLAQVSEPTPDYNSGIFNLAKASALAPTTPAFSNYLSSVYTAYHGSTSGLSQVTAAAQANSAPPAGFKILSKADVANAAAIAKYNAEVQAAKNALPDPNTFAGIVARLKRPDLAAGEWRQVKGQGFELKGVATSVATKAVEIAVPISANAPSNLPNLRVLLAAPLSPKKRPKVGQTITVKGLVVAYKPNPPDPNAPFLLTMNEGSVEGYLPVAPKAGGGQ